jgi:dipeptidyl aminopeptidase/acylaminoacyl peptidase
MHGPQYGSWESIITPEFVCGGANLPWETQIEGDTYYWTEQRPSEGGRTVLIRWNPQEGSGVALPDGYSIRTKIYVYGGSAYCASGNTVYFVNEKDQCIYSYTPGNGNPRQITAPGYKFAELRFIEGGLIALAEDDSDHHFLALVDVATGAVHTIVSGADFYSSPVISPDNKRIAWIEWNHPYMSWDESSLWVGEWDGNEIKNKIKIAGEEQESVSQPVWKDAHTLGFISDRTGWWNLYEWDGEKINPLQVMEAEFSVPQWRFNTTWGYVNGSPICAYKGDAGWKLGLIQKEMLINFPLPFNSYAQVKTCGSRILFIAGSQLKTNAVYTYIEGQLIQLSPSQCEIAEEWVSLGSPIKFPSKDTFAYGYYYPPKNPHYMIDGPPPLIVKIHGGPTGAAEVSLRPALQYWTSRGFAIFDVDYTGSTGYGRTYRDALNGSWGIADRDDILCGVKYLVERGLADPARLYISGSSAGGFTLLRALICENIFAKAVCYYAVSDLEALAKDTHKFEKHYLDRLIAPYPERRDVYVERSPIQSIENIKAQMLIFQGGNDPVVPPEQSKSLHKRLKDKGISSELVLYEGEGHGFRILSTLLDTLQRELQFFNT